MDGGVLTRHETGFTAGCQQADEVLAAWRARQDHQLPERHLRSRLAAIT
jgi:hypothetical protein